MKPKSLEGSLCEHLNSQSAQDWAELKRRWIWSRFINIEKLTFKFVILKARQVPLPLRKKIGVGKIQWEGSIFSTWGEVGGGRGNILEKFWRKMTPWALNPDLEIHPFDLVTLVKTKNSGRLLNDTFSVFRQNIKKKTVSGTVQLDKEPPVLKLYLRVWKGYLLGTLNRESRFFF